MGRGGVRVAGGEVKLRWVELWYGAELAARLRSHLGAKKPHRHGAEPDGE